MAHSASIRQLLAFLALSVVGHIAVSAYFGRDPVRRPPQRVDPVHVRIVRVKAVAPQVAQRVAVPKAPPLHRPAQARKPAAASARRQPEYKLPGTRLPAPPAPEPTRTAASPSGRGTATQAAPTQSLSDAELGATSAAYLAALRAKIEDEKRYPTVARARRQAGRVEVGITVTKSGRITGIHLVNACPFQLLNEAALAAVGAAHEFLPIPDELHRQAWEVVVPIVFKM